MSGQPVKAGTKSIAGMGVNASGKLAKGGSGLPFIGQGIMKVK